MPLIVELRVMNKAPVNRIIPFSNVDGPGNRMALFLQKCPLKCLYCHNPETINECLHCGICIDFCPVNALETVVENVVWDKEKCINCDTCIKECPHLSSPKITLMSVNDVLVEIGKIRPLIRGITVSGGECMEHPEFLTELFTEVRKLGLSCLIDSSGFYDFAKYPELLECCDGVMLDVKAIDNTFHQYLTSVSNDTVLKNLEHLLNENKLYEVRTVLMNNRSEENEKTVCEVAKIVQDKCRYKLIKYRPFGVRAEGLVELGSVSCSDEELSRCWKLARQIGATNTVTV